jgi:hypothetical protein
VVLPGQRSRISQYQDSLLHTMVSKDTIRPTVGHLHQIPRVEIVLHCWGAFFSFCPTSQCRYIAKGALFLPTWKRCSITALFQANIYKVPCFSQLGKGAVQLPNFRQIYTKVGILGGRVTHPRSASKLRPPPNGKLALKRGKSLHLAQ